MGSSLSILKLKLAASKYGLKIAIILSILFVITSGVAFTGVAQSSGINSTGNEQTLANGSELQDQKVLELTKDVEVTMTNDTEAYSHGESLENQNIYPMEESEGPIVSATARSNGPNVTDMEFELIMEATYSGDDDPFWEESIGLSESDQDLQSNEIEKVGAIDIDEISDRQEALEDEFGNDVDVETTVSTIVAFEYQDYDVSGDYVEKTPQQEALINEEEINIGEQMFEVGSGTETEVIEIERPEDTTVEEGGFNITHMGALITSILLAIGALASVRTYRNSNTEELELEVKKARHDSWITTVEAYKPAHQANRTNVPQLVDLVDLAIDTNNRVIYCQTKGYFAVSTEKKEYVFDPKRYKSENQDGD